MLGQPTDIAVDPKTDEVYITDGYTNRRVIVFDANTGAYKRHWGAFGQRPDDAPDAGVQPGDARASSSIRRTVPRWPTMACVYICDRGNQRIQVFRKDGTFVKDALDHDQAGRRLDGRHAVGHRVLDRQPADLHLSGRRRQPSSAHAPPRNARGGRQLRTTRALAPGSSNRRTASPSTRRATCSSPRRSTGVESSASRRCRAAVGGRAKVTTRHNACP